MTVRKYTLLGPNFSPFVPIVGPWIERVEAQIINDQDYDAYSY